MDEVQEGTQTPLDINSAAAKILAMEEPSQEELSSEESNVEESTTEEVSAEPETEGEEETSDVSDEEESSDLSELREYLAESPDIYDSLDIPVKIDGKEGKATIEELRASYQIGKALDQRKDELANLNKEIEGLRSQNHTEVNQELEQAKGLVTALEQQFMKEFEEIDWNDLRSTDPAEFSAKRQEMLERQSGLQNVKNHIVQQQQQGMAETFRTHIEEQQKLLPKIIPEWSDEKVAKTESGELRDYLISQGVPKETIDGQTDANGNVISPGISDAVSIMLARKAMMYDKGAEKVNVAKKKVKKVPKVTRPGKVTTKAEIDSESAKKKRGRLKKSGRVEDAASLIYDNLFGG